MISLDQVLLLQKKVETAVERIRMLNGEVAQLKADNAALRTECEELKNALSAKTGLVSTMEADQNRIEESILNALNQLDTVENALLSGMEPTVSADSNARAEAVQADGANEAASFANETPAADIHTGTVQLNDEAVSSAGEAKTDAVQEETVMLNEVQADTVQENEAPENSIQQNFDIF